MRKVIFLDIDGVLNTKWWYTQMDRNTPKDKYGYAFDPNAVANLKRIIDETDADIVISSSQKSFGFELQDVINLYAIYQTQRKRAILCDWLLRKYKRNNKIKFEFNELTSLLCDIEVWDKKRR